MNSSLIVTIVNSGYADTVMNAARNAGARGGTVIYGRGTGNSETARILGIIIEPEKEVVLIVADVEDQNTIMKAVSQAAGIDQNGNGVCFCLPISDTLGFGKNN